MYAITIKGKTYNITKDTETRWTRILRENPENTYAIKRFLDRLEMWKKAPTLTDRQLASCICQYYKALSHVKYTTRHERFSEFWEHIRYMCKILYGRLQRNSKIDIPERYREEVEMLIERSMDLW